MMCSMSSSTLVTANWRSWRSVNSLKNRSTRLSQEAEGRVKWKWTRLLRANYALTLWSLCKIFQRHYTSRELYALLQW